MEEPIRIQGFNHFQTNGIFHKATIKSGWPIVYIEGSHVKISKKKYIVLLSLNLYFVLANSADPDEMTHYAAFHLGLHCLPKYLFKGYCCRKG